MLSPPHFCFHAVCLCVSPETISLLLGSSNLIWVSSTHGLDSAFHRGQRILLLLTILEVNQVARRYAYPLLRTLFHVTRMAQMQV